MRGLARVEVTIRAAELAEVTELAVFFAKMIILRTEDAKRYRCQLVYVCIQLYPTIVLWQARTKPLHEKTSLNSFGSTPAVFGGIVEVTKTHFTAKVPHHPHQKQV